MSKIMVNVANTMTGKAEEVETLEKLANAFKGTGSYLESLFSEQLVTFFSDQVKNDFTADIADLYFSMVRSGSSELTYAKEEAKEAKAGEAKMLAEYESIRERFSAEIKRNQDQQQRNDQTIYQLQRDLTTEQMNHINTAAALEEAKQTIVELKAKLYDLLTK